MLKFTETMIGKPFTWRTNLYGDIAVHVEKFSPNGAVANLTIDGGPDATPCQRYPELADGIGFAVEGGLLKRMPQKRPSVLPERALAERAGVVSRRRADAIETVKDVSGAVVGLRGPRRVRTKAEQEMVIAQGMQRKRARRTASDAEVTF